MEPTTFERKTLIKKIGRKETSKFDMANRYYSILSSIGDWGLTNREIQLIAFTAIKGNISYGDVKEEFCNTYKSSSATINNIVSKLSKKGFFIKDGTKVKVHPSLLIDFDSNIVIISNISHIENTPIGMNSLMSSTTVSESQKYG